MSKRIIVLARAPLPGRCKTRLIPRLGAHGAARLYRQLLLRTLRTAHRIGVPLELCCVPDTRHPLFLACRRNFGVRLRRQPAGNLGRKMALTLARALSEGAAAAVLVGTDCPAFTADDFNSAFAALKNGNDAVLQPSSDGGYVLIGARRIESRALACIAWSSGRELAQTQRRFGRLNLRHIELVARTDVDTPGDYWRARRAGLI